MIKEPMYKLLTKTPKFLLTWFVLDILLLVLWFSGSSLNAKVMALSALTAGLLSFLFYEENRRFTNWLAVKNRFNFIKFLLLGLAGSVVVEFIFWFWGRALASSGAVSPSNLLLDLKLTLPLYFLVVLSFWVIQRRKNYPLREVFIIGGIYQLIVGSLVAIFFKGGLFLSLVYGVAGLPIFMVIYSLILFPPALFLRRLKS